MPSPELFKFFYHSPSQDTVCFPILYTKSIPSSLKSQLEKTNSHCQLFSSPSFLQPNGWWHENILSAVFLFRCTHKNQKDYFVMCWRYYYRFFQNGVWAEDDDTARSRRLLAFSSLQADSKLSGIKYLLIWLPSLFATILPSWKGGYFLQELLTLFPKGP